jgi:hypothetical protein
MAPKKSVGLIGAACLSAGWLVASLLTPPVARVQTLPQRRTAATAQADEAPTPITLLPLGAPSASAAPLARRNPFVYARRAGPDSVAMPLAETAPTGAGVAPPPAAPAVVAPHYTLSGIATTGDARTAVLSDGTSVHLVTTGQPIGAYTVVAVSESSVTLADAAGEQFVLRLR